MIAVVIVAQQTNSVFDFTVLHPGHAAAETVRAEGKNLEWTVTGCAKEGLLELKTLSFGSLPNAVGSFLAWRVENQEGSKWNRFGIHTNNAAYRFGIHTNNAANGLGFSLYGSTSKGASLPVLAVTNASTKERARNLWEAPVAVMGFPSFRFEVDAVASTDVSVNAFMTLYCKPASTGSCPAVGDFPAVGEGQISPAACPEGFQGYAYRECANGVLGDVKNDKCEYLLPEAIQYENSNMEFVLNTEVSSGKPAYKNIITEFFMQSSTPLPEGLSIDATTGKPVKEMEQRAFTVCGKNPAGETIVEVTVAMRKGYCQPEGVFERTNVGEVAVYQCSMQGSYVGTQKRACVLGRRVAEGEWQLPAHYGNRDCRGDCDSGYRGGGIHPDENEKEQVGWRREGEGCD